MAKNTNYTSDAMSFIRELVRDNVELEIKRKDFIKTWWDKNPQEVEEERQLDKTNLKCDGYAYY